TLSRSDIRIGLLIESRLGFNNRARLLRRRPVVQIGQALAPNGTSQDRKILAVIQQTSSSYGHRRIHARSPRARPPGNKALIPTVARLRRLSEAMRSRDWAANA